MEFMLICCIVGIALLLAFRRIIRTLREPAPPCCGCDSCNQPDVVKQACSGTTINADNSRNSSAGNNGKI